MNLKECLAQEYTVDWGNPFGERTVYIKTPMRLEDFDFEEEKKTDLNWAARPRGLYVDYIGVDMKELLKKKKEEKKMPIYACNMFTDDVLKAFGITNPPPSKKTKWIEGLPDVKKVETYNNRVVKVTFIDGTYTKAVCSENDNFDLDMGITICAMKRLLGTNSENATREYNRFINHVHFVMKKNTLKELAEEAQKAKEKQKQRKAELKRAAKKLKAREEQIDIQKQAIIRAQKELEAEDQ